jgi:hypothetical protein
MAKRGEMMKTIRDIMLESVQPASRAINPQGFARAPAAGHRLRTWLGQAERATNDQDTFGSFPRGPSSSRSPATTFRDRFGGREAW